MIVKNLKQPTFKKEATIVSFCSIKLFVTLAFRFANTVAWTEWKESLGQISPFSEETLKNSVCLPPGAAWVRVIREDFSTQDREEEQEKEQRASHSEVTVTACLSEYLV